MQPFIGRKKSLGFGVESTWGVVAPSATWVEYLEFNPNTKKEDLIDESATGRIENAVGSTSTRRFSEPSASFVCKRKSIGMFLYATFGVITSTVDMPMAGQNTHVFTVKNDNSPVSLSMFYKDGNRDKVIAGCVVNTIKFSFVQNDFVKVDVEFIGKNTADTVSTPVYEEDSPFNGTQAGIKIADTLAGLSAASPFCFTEMEIEIKKNADAESFFCLGSTEPKYIANTTFGLSGSATRVYKDQSLFDRWQADTKTAFRFEVVDPVNNASLNIDIAPSLVKDWEEGTGLDDIVTESVKFDGIFSVTEGKMIEAKLINDVEAYI